MGRISDKEDFFIFKCQEKQYKPYKPNGGSIRDTIYIQLRNKESESLEQFFEGTFFKTEATYPFFYLKRNSKYKQKLEACLKS